MALSALPRFPLLGKIVALVLVLLALVIALQMVSDIVAEREGRLREAEASVAASLAGSQTVLGPILRATAARPGRRCRPRARTGRS